MIISGGPGSGKSSFAKILASELAEQMQPVLFIPLHRIEFDKYLLNDIKEFINLELSSDEAESITAEHGLLFIFDGLDELTMQGDNIKEKANDFVTKLNNFLHNNQNKQWKALVTGREIAVQTQKNVLSEEKNIFYLLPYFVSEDERKQYQNNTILEADQRNEWWSKYAQLKDLDHTSLPTAINTEHLEPITSEPLLNYLVAISFLNSDIIFDNETSLNQIYASLLDSVYKRKYSSHKHTSLQDIESQDKFEEILQAVAIAVWHHNGRTATISQINKQCEKDNLSQYFDNFKDSAKDGTVDLLMSFYFREFGSKEGDKTFEFTHKSFGEYLTARRIIREISNIFEYYEFDCTKRGEPTALMRAFENWIKLFGKQEFDNDIGTFVQGELKIIAEQDNELQLIEKYQTLMIDLINLAIDNKSPVKNLHLATFAEDLIYRRNSESAMLQIHSYCGELTNKRVKKVGSASKTGISTWLKNIQNNHAPLNYLTFKDVQDFEGGFFNTKVENSDFTNMCFIDASLPSSTFIDTICINVEFHDVNLFFGYFINCDISGSTFGYSILRESKMVNTNCSQVIFEHTDIINTTFENVDFTDAKFNNTSIDQATIDKFENITFNNTIVTGTLLANDPEAITDEDGVVRLTKVFNPTDEEEK